MYDKYNCLRRATYSFIWLSSMYGFHYSSAERKKSWTFIYIPLNARYLFLFVCFILLHNTKVRKRCFRSCSWSRDDFSKYRYTYRNWLFMHMSDVCPCELRAAVCECVCMLESKHAVGLIRAGSQSGRHLISYNTRQTNKWVVVAAASIHKYVHTRRSCASELRTHRNQWQYNLPLYCERSIIRCMNNTVPWIRLEQQQRKPKQGKRRKTNSQFFLFFFRSLVGRLAGVCRPHLSVCGCSCVCLQLQSSIQTDGMRVWRLKKFRFYFFFSGSRLCLMHTLHTFKSRRQPCRWRRQQRLWRWWCTVHFYQFNSVGKLHATASFVLFLGKTSKRYT